MQNRRHDRTPEEVVATYASLTDKYKQAASRYADRHPRVVAILCIVTVLLGIVALSFGINGDSVSGSVFGILMSISTGILALKAGVLEDFDSTLKGTLLRKRIDSLGKKLQQSNSN